MRGLDNVLGERLRVLGVSLLFTEGTRENGGKVRERRKQ